MSDTFAGFELREISGVPVLSRRDDRFKTFRIVFHARRPLDDRAAARSVLPALLLLGTEVDPSRPALARRMESMYGAGVVPSTHKRGESHVLRLTLDAVAGRYLPGEVDQCREGLRFLSDYLARPLLDGAGFPAKSFLRERAMAVDAARSLIDDRTSYAYERAIETACEGEPMAIPEYGGIAALERLDRRDPEAARRDFLSSGQAWIVAAGALPDDGLGERIEEFLAGLPARAPEPVPGPIEVAERPPRRQVDRVELQQSKLVLVFRMPEADSETWVGRRLFVNMFGGGSHSRLFKEVREKRSLAYYASAACDRHKGLLTVQIGLDEAAAEDAEAESLAQLEDLAAGNFDARELDTARAGMLSAITSVGDSTLRRGEFTSEQWLLQVDRTPDELFAQYQAADRELVLRGAEGAWLDTSYLLAPRGEGET